MYCCITFCFEVYKICFRIVLTTVAKLSYKLGWRVTLSGTALDAWVQRYTKVLENAPI